MAEFIIGESQRYELEYLPDIDDDIYDGTTVVSRALLASESVKPHIEPYLPQRLQGYYLAEGAGVDINSVHVTAEGRLLGLGDKTAAGVNELLTEFKTHGINAEIQIISSDNIPEEYARVIGQDVNPNEISKFAILVDKRKKMIIKDNSNILGYAKFDYNDLDNPIPHNVGFRLLETSQIADRPYEILKLTNETLRSFAVNELDSTFRRVLENTIDETTLNIEKATFLDQLLTLLDDTSPDYNLTPEDRVFLEQYEQKILSGQYDQVLKKATIDAMISFALIQSFAAPSTALGTQISANLHPALAPVGGALGYIGAPVAAWLYMQGRGVYMNEFRNWRQSGGSFLGFLLPVVGGGAAYPLSIDLQTHGELTRFKNLAHNHRGLRAEMTSRIVTADRFLHGLNPKNYREYQLPPQKETAEQSPWKKMFEVSFNGGDDGVEVVIPTTEESKIQVARQVAKEYLAHNLNNINDDPELLNIGTEQNPDWIIKDYNGKGTNWLVVRDKETGQIILTSKLISRQKVDRSNGHRDEIIEDNAFDDIVFPHSEHQNLPMQNELGLRFRTQTFEGVNAEDMITFNPNYSEPGIYNFDHEMGRVSFNFEAYGNPRQGTNKQKMEALYKYSVSMMAWVKGVKNYMEANGIAEFGAVFTRVASRHMTEKMLGTIGFREWTNDFYYMPQDKSHNIKSTIISLNLEDAREIMRVQNPNLYRFIFEPESHNNISLREDLWNDVIERATTSSRKSLKKTLQNLTQRAYLKFNSSRLLNS